MCEFTNDNQEDNESGNPGPEFVGMYYLVTEKCDKEGTYGNNDDSSVSWNIVIDSVDELGTNNDID